MLSHHYRPCVPLLWGLPLFSHIYRPKILFSSRRLDQQVQSHIAIGCSKFNEPIRDRWDSIEFLTLSTNELLFRHLHLIWGYRASPYFIQCNVFLSEEKDCANVRMFFSQRYEIYFNAYRISIGVLTGTTRWNSCFPNSRLTYQSFKIRVFHFVFSTVILGTKILVP